MTPEPVWLDEEDDEWAEQLDKCSAYIFAGIGCIIGFATLFFSGWVIGLLVGGLLGRGIGVAWAFAFIALRRFFLQRSGRWPSVLTDGDEGRAFAVLITLSPVLAPLVYMLLHTLMFA